MSIALADGLSAFTLGTGIGEGRTGWVSVVTVRTRLTATPAHLDDQVVDGGVATEGVDHESDPAHLTADHFG